MHIVCAESVESPQEILSPLGRISVFPDESLSAEHLRDADALVVRSKTPVNQRLLEDSPVRFVATATSGQDHIDTAYLDAAGIAWFAARGCNARSVGEYVLYALLCLERHTGRALQGSVLGIIGAGHCGTAAARLAEAAGMTILLNDPPRQEKEGSKAFTPLEDLLHQSDFVSLHVPLERQGPFPTHGLAGHAFLSAMKQGAMFINASRGEVHDEKALARALDARHLGGAVLDVFANEPAVDPGLVRRLVLATPHIAGYSLDGRRQGTIMVADWLSRQAEIQVPQPCITEDLPIPLPAGNASLFDAVRAATGLDQDDQAFRIGLQHEDPAACFRRLRSRYRVRREFFCWKAPAADPSLASQLLAVGFSP